MPRAGYFDALTRAVFQPGLNWKVIEAKWPDIGRVLDGFDPAKIADLRRRFRFLGGSGVYYVLWSVGEEVSTREEVPKER